MVGMKSDATGPGDRDEQGRGTIAARRAFDAAPADPGAALALLGRLAEAPLPEDVLALLEKVQTHHPQRAAVWTWSGLIADRAGHPALATDHYRRALALDPHDKVARHNLATQLRTNAHEEEALDILRRGASSARPAESWMLLAHLCGDLGYFEEALDAYRQALEMSPALVPAHESLSRLLPQLGRSGEAMGSYERALGQHPEDRALWASAISTAKDLRLGADLEQLAGLACDRFGASPDLLVALALGFAYQGNGTLALAQLQRVLAADPHNLAAQLHIIPLLLSAGDLREAERAALCATRLDPLDQSGWAWLTIIWRLLEDPREAWLADYERFVLPIDINEALLASGAGFRLGDLADHLAGLHKTSHHPLEQSPRGGTQTRGDLFKRDDAMLVAFRDVVQTRILAALSELPRDDSHPFLSRRADRGIDFAGAWSVRLRSGGHHAHHIHHKGWISSAFYASLPPSVGKEGSCDGALVFGVPEADLPVDLAPRRLVTPKEGQLVLFPSYFWHGTLPFDDEAHRLTIAFDLLPAS